MTHKNKIKLARKMRTRAEELAGVPLFQTRQWLWKKQAAMMRTNPLYKDKVIKISKEAEKKEYVQI